MEIKLINESIKNTPRKEDLKTLEEMSLLSESIKNSPSRE